MWYMLRCIVLTLSFLLFLGQNTWVGAQNEQSFIVTAYYSPLPGQSSYFNGSYAREIRVNGKGTHGASGKAVFEWMLAAPSNYPFGTKIYFEGLGIAEVQDRGGAIRQAGWWGKCIHDCIDIWMGHGEEWLQRARAWGVRTITGKIVPSGSENTIQFGESQIGNIVNLKVNPESGPQEVTRLQEIFTKAELYSGPIDGIYSSIRESLIDFQISSGIIPSRDHIEAGYFGNKTTRALASIYKIPSPLVEEEKESFWAFEWPSHSDEQQIILDYGTLEISPESDATDIRELQQLMQKLWEYNWKIDGKYSSIETPLIELQKKIGVIWDRDDWWAGYFGNKTKASLFEYYSPTVEASSQIESEPETTTPVFSSSETIPTTLSWEQRQKLNSTILDLRVAIEKIALKQNKNSDSLEEKLAQDINKILPSIENSLLQLKLEYIAQNL